MIASTAHMEIPSWTSHRGCLHGHKGETGAAKVDSQHYQTPRTTLPLSELYHTISTLCILNNELIPRASIPWETRSLRDTTDILARESKEYDTGLLLSTPVLSNGCPTDQREDYRLILR
jgi:hypothetical protein